MLEFEFYPTPIEVIENMLQFKDIEGKRILEPSAGNGNIVEYCIERGAIVEAVEKQDDLRAILSNKCNVIGKDFLDIRKEDISHIDMIVMNPPFSNGLKHIKHAWEIAPEGCEIISLFNYDNLNAGYYRFSEERVIFDEYGIITELGNVFAQADRKTNVNVGMVELHKPVVSDSFDFDGFFFEEEEIVQGYGLVTHSSVRNIVEYYVRSVKEFSKFDKIASNIETYLGVLEINNPQIGVSIISNKTARSKEDFVKDLQKTCWKLVFDKLRLNKYVTQDVMAKLNEFVETQSKVPFTMKNIYRMIEIIIGTRDNFMNKSIKDAIDVFTRHTHGNRYNVEGWKTNSGHMLNKKIIIENVVDTRWSENKLSVCLSSYNANRLDDLMKAICYISGLEYNDYDSLSEVLNKNDISPNKPFVYGVWDCKGFKKGTLHLTFRDEKIWEQLNRKYAEIIGESLPERI